MSNQERRRILKKESSGTFLGRWFESQSKTPKSIAACACPSSARARFRYKLRSRYAHNALGQRVFKTEPLYTASQASSSTKNLNNLLADDDEETEATNPQAEQPGFIEQLTNFFTKLWSPGTSDAEKLGWSYLYAEDGSLLGEYGQGSATTTGTTQYIWLPTASGPMPIAAIVKGRHYAVHSDHLNTPRRLTQSNGRVAWQWAYSAFGDETPTTAAQRFTNETTNPTTGTTSTPEVTFNLRYPGQYFDKETNLHYNYYRTYKPDTGRYTQGDPIGLEGGWNRFSYVDGNPLSYTDPKGLIRICSVLTGQCWDTNPPPIDPDFPPPPPVTFPNPIKPIINFIKSCFPEESCEEKWNEEHKACQKWAGFGTRWVRACEDRANNRLRLCRGNGGSMPPDAPEPWRPDGNAGGR